MIVYHMRCVDDPSTYNKGITVPIFQPCGNRLNSYRTMLVWRNVEEIVPCGWWMMLDMLERRELFIEPGAAKRPCRIDNEQMLFVFANSIGYYPHYDWYFPHGIAEMLNNAILIPTLTPSATPWGKGTFQIVFVKCCQRIVALDTLTQ